MLRIDSTDSIDVSNITEVLSTEVMLKRGIRSYVFTSTKRTVEVLNMRIEFWLWRLVNLDRKIISVNLNENREKQFFQQMTQRI